MGTSDRTQHPQVAPEFEPFLDLSGPNLCSLTEVCPAPLFSGVLFAMNRFAATTLAVGIAASSLWAADPVDFKKQVRPILEANCLKCHGLEKPKAGLSLVTRADAIKGGDGGPSLKPGDPAKSPLYVTTTLPEDHDNVMPPKGDKLTKEQQNVLKVWIEQGAPWPEDIQLVQRQRVEWKQVASVFEVQCVKCHRPDLDKGDLDMTTREKLLSHRGALVPGDAASSSIYTSTVLPPDHADLMPPKSKGGPIAPRFTDLIRDWIDQGAAWPTGVVLVVKEASSSLTRDDAKVIEAVHALVVATTKETEATQMKPYTEKLPGTPGAFDLVPIPGGEFLMGSPETEEKRKPNEGPQRKVKIEPFWMSKLETRWNEYELFMFPGLEKGTNIASERVFGELLINLGELPPNATGNPYTGKEGDAVSRPTTPYVEMSFGMGKDGFPAISMTHFAAVMYCRWLTAKTGHFYRLPTEAEWEYACRAGTTTAYSFGDDPEKIAEYGWFFTNADGKYAKVGKLKPNPWGLYDMHGNVAEWVMDAYLESYANFPEGAPYVPATTEYPHVARGGSWDDEPDLLRSSARRSSDASWKMRDPQLPKSKWYLTDAQFLGMRVVRPLKVPSPEEMARWWTSFPPKKQ